MVGSYSLEIKSPMAEGHRAMIGESCCFHIRWRIMRNRILVLLDLPGGEKSRGVKSIKRVSAYLSQGKGAIQLFR